MAVDIEVRDHILCITLSGVLTQSDLMRVGRAMGDAENQSAVAPPRICDFTAVDTIEVGFGELLGLAEQRRHSTLSNPVRSAMVVGNAVQLGMSRMFQTLNDNPMVTLEIFEDRETAMRWLRG